MEKEEISKTLSKIIDHAKEMLSFPDAERVLRYQTLDPLLLGLDAELVKSPNPYVAEKLEELKVHLIVMARLDEPDGYTDEEHCTRALNVVEELRNGWSPRPFDPVNAGGGIG